MIHALQQYQTCGLEETIPGMIEGSFLLLSFFKTMFFLAFQSSDGLN
jgi:hypothetical protein